ncbi:SIS domain-containing protein [Streptomyces sp. NPDC088812]|uniref:D-sedoheptulose-7-phosphate isomerase n=1 Tax=Streptomyces sp. NPDC088812 TaxID=3365905 RepID=UPI0038300FF0
MTIAPVNNAAGILPSVADHVRTARRYLDELVSQASRVDTEQLAAFTQQVLDTVHRGGTVFIAGNGGSASTAGHMACDWVNACARAGIPRVDIVNLSDGVAMLTALANDVAYEEVFARQLAPRGTRGDLLVLLSVSGNSPNLLAAARQARRSGMQVAGLLGNQGEIAQYCDVVTVVGGGDYGLAEDLHLAFNHVVVRALGNGAPLRYEQRKSGV